MGCGGHAFALTIAMTVASSGCASTTYAYRKGDNRVSDAIEEPFRDSGWTRETPPDVLLRAAEAPYAAPGDADCSTILNGIAALDLVLGPDVDAIDKPKDRSDLDISGLMSSAIGGVVGLPFRSVVRRLSGASGRDRILVNAIFAGMVRRAYLKGVARTACAVALPSPEAAPRPVPMIVQQPAPTPGANGSSQGQRIDPAAR